MARRKYIKRIRNGVKVARKTIRIPKNTFDQAFLNSGVQQRSINSVVLEWMRRGSLNPVDYSSFPSPVKSLINVPWKNKVIAYIPEDLVQLCEKTLAKQKSKMKKAGVKTVVKGKNMCESYIYSHWIILGAWL